MSHPKLSIGQVVRVQATGVREELSFFPGVNVLVGRPNTGKTKWLQTIDYLLGDSGENPFAGPDESGLAAKYISASVELIFDGRSIHIERRWHEPGARTKIFVDGRSMSGPEFQGWLLSELKIPALNFPKGNPMSGQTWPELSFRMLLRHVYRQQRFWTDIADKQPDGEQLACLMQFLGLAEQVFTEDYGRLVVAKMESERLRARRDQYVETLQHIASGVLGSAQIGRLSAATLLAAEENLVSELESLRERRVVLLSSALNEATPAAGAGFSRAVELGEKRAGALTRLEELHSGSNAVATRLYEIGRYRSDLIDELARMDRAEEAGAILSGLRITHCPACDQSVANEGGSPEHCFLCHQTMPDEPMIRELGAVRLRFESDRLKGELKEADELLAVLQRDAVVLERDIAVLSEMLHKYENELAPMRQAIGALAQDGVSEIDLSVGELRERRRQLQRIGGALEVGGALTERIQVLEGQIKPLQESVDESTRAADFDAAAALLEDGMNAYLSAINVLKPGIWSHSLVAVDISRSAITFRVGAKRWHAVLGGTDTLYFLMAYHYGLLSISGAPGTHYPGLSIIDVPGEFSGEAIEDKENFIVQPFINLLSKAEYEGAQLIITGASFTGLVGAARQHLRNVHVA